MLFQYTLHVYFGLTLELIYALFSFFFTKLHILQLDDATGGEHVLVIDDAEGENIVTTDTARLESVVVYVRLYYSLLCKLVFFNENGLYSSVSILIDSLKLTVKFGKYELINHELANLWIWSWKIVLYTFKEAGGSKKFLQISPNLQKYFVSDGLHGDDQGYGGIGPIGRR